MGTAHGTSMIVRPMGFMLLILALSIHEISASAISSTVTQPGRSLLEIGNASEPIVGADDTVRVDPLDGFKKYRDGFDITNEHYWSSVIFTGVYGYAIGVVWLLCGVLYGGFLLASSFFSSKQSSKPKKRSPSCHRQCYMWPILVAISLTVLSVVATGVALGGNAKFYSEAKTVVRIIINTANEASTTIYNTTGAMKGLRDNLEDSPLEEGSSVDDEAASGFLTGTSQRLDAEANNIERQARKNRRIIDKVLEIVFITATVAISLNLIALIALTVCGIFRLQEALKLLIALCWVLTALCWVFFGIFFFLENFSSDTCNALKSFEQNPSNNSLSAILPCDEVISAKPILSDVSAGIYNLVNQVNANISALQATTFPSLVHVCNPFSAPPDYQYQPDNCPNNTVKIGEIPQILKVFTCSGAGNSTCRDGEFISISEYRRVEAYTSSVQELLNAYPGMANLVECQSVTNAFSEILSNHCKPVKRHTKMAWAAMVVLSVFAMALVLIWTVRARHEQQAHSSEASVKPHPTSEEGSEPSSV